MLSKLLIQLYAKMSPQRPTGAEAEGKNATQQAHHNISCAFDVRGYVSGGASRFFDILII